MTEDEIISDIINSFEKFGLADIQHNIDRPIAAYILCICFIDQLSSYAYPIETRQKKRAEAFISRYVSDYDGVGLYKKFRDSIIHNYSPQDSEDAFALTVGGISTPYHKENDTIIINTTFLINGVTKGFDVFKRDLLDEKSQERKCALRRYRKHPIFIEKG
ncbi:MAG: hypothetical protein ABUT20_63460 [Bacteroidota bacterium]